MSVGAEATGEGARKGVAADSVAFVVIRKQLTVAHLGTADYPQNYVGKPATD
jgi:hypothetical protein